MSKIKEMSDNNLAKYITHYEKKVKSEPENEDFSKILKGMKEEFTTRGLSLQEAPTRAEGLEADEHSFDDNVVNATFLSRGAAVIIDTIITQVISNFLIAAVAISGLIPKESEAGLLLTTMTGILIGMSVPLVYAMILLTRDGQTIGKRVLGIKVIYSDEQYAKEHITPLTVIKRELIGKMISGLFFAIGYIVVLFDKTAWHDTIAHTQVIKVK